MLLAILAFSVSVGYAAALSAGSCVCVTASALNARDGAGTGTHGHVVTTMSHGECHIFNGGVHTRDGHTWYELQDVHGHHRVWAASEHLQVGTASQCHGGSGSVSGGSGGSHGFAHGIVSQECMQCICMQESGCRPLGCAWDVNSNSCGYFQIKKSYWLDCGQLGSSWEACAQDKHCASQCVQKYMARYAKHYGCAATCEAYAREHNGGPRGCHSSATLGYWSHMKGLSGCAHLR